MSRRDESAARAPAGPPVTATDEYPMGVERSGSERGAAPVECAGAALNGDLEPPRKRARPPEDAAALRRRLLDHQLQRLKLLRDRFTDQLCELYFLQAGGNMMDYAAWRKRPPAPALQAFLDARRPPAPAPPPEPPPEPAPDAAAVAGQEVVEKAKQEAYVARRVAELSRAGLWAERRLPRVLEPPRAKSHWDYLLEEMAWLAQDFAHERKWKKQAAKKCARAVQKYFQDKAAAAQKAEKAQELHLRKVAAFTAKEIRTFWTNVEKLVEWKRERRVERARKQALDQQLSYIVDRTERYSRALAANLAPPSQHSPPPSPRRDDYHPSDDSADDEGTIAEQERRERSEDHAAELAALQQDADLDLDELVRRYRPATPAETASPPGSDSDSDESDSDASSSASSDSPQLEALMEAEEGAEGGEQRVEACANVAATLQPRGTTLADTPVGTPVPRLLKHSLREYQHVGLHWLATMHSRGLNGILADEMGLGKTIQTIALLAHLALELQDWGPHLVVAPTSVVLNWEMEFKKWCPAFKILTYYGTIKERKLKRVGWTKANSFHICITSYKLVVQDHQSFRRKRWKYLILDEAQNIKNFKSQRWQTLLNFQTERRLLLTGTPLQNSLLELWSLMHFLMPAVFASHSHFREWFAEVAAAAEGAARNDALVRRLHEVLRPFLLRRLKADVERQMPRKYEHVLLCRLARRQRCLYDDFMARAKTKESLASGNLLSVINVLMQLRKVCNHPDLFEPRPVVSPLQLTSLQLHVPSIVLLPCSDHAARIGGDLASLEVEGAGAFAAHRARHLAPPRRVLQQDALATPAPPAPPPATLRLHLRLVPRAPPQQSALLPAPPVSCPIPPSRPPAPAPPPPAPGSAARLAAHRRAARLRLAQANERRCWRLPLYGADLRAALYAGPPPRPPKDLDELLAEMHAVIDRFSVCWTTARAQAPQLVAGGGEGARDWRRRSAGVSDALLPPLRRVMAALHAPAARQAVAFPHPSLLQYDCGKLQTLSELLRRLKTGGHRVLIFTQMTRVLDVLEAFLSMHGHTYLRLDGATRVDARQHLVERFNADPRVFAMILSTRSGGVGLNLTGADTVVFYDSDWNPTMDAQAQDRAHRIGQTRDVHVYRLVTAATVEENILRKADQKRQLGHLAIEDGHFTTSYLRQANIKELFGDEAAATTDKPSECPPTQGAELETALAACEDEADAAAARAARAEQRKDLAEFDETQPLDEEQPQACDAQDVTELAALMKQLTPIEKYAMRVVESSDAATSAEREALDDMRRQLHEWEDKRRQLRQEDPPPTVPVTDDLTYSREDARASVWLSSLGGRAPLWAPPTPPAADTDVHCDTWARALYRAGPVADDRLPPGRPAPHRRAPRPRLPARPAPAPHGLFERAGPRRPRPRPHAPPARDAPHQPDWTPAEDAALRRALRLQRLPPDAPPARAVNWDWASELVNEVARAYRSPRAARDRHEAREEPERARRKHRRPTGARRRDEEGPRARLPLARLDAMRDAAERRRAQPKRRLDDAHHHNPKHAALLADHGVDYEAPPTPMDVASRRAERIAKEKLKAAAPPPAPAPAPRVVVAAPASAPATQQAPQPPAECRAPALFRQQALTARHQLKILHTSQGQPLAQAGTSVSEASSAALRALQLQQLSLRRAPSAGGAGGAGGAGAAPAGPRAPSHVVVAHLTPAHHHVPQPQPPPPHDPTQ